MFAKTAVVAALAALVVASPLVSRTGGVNQCNTGPVQCCNSLQDANSQQVGLLGGLLGIGALLQGITGQVGIVCNPLSVIGVGGNSCTQQPVCCENNNFNGVIALGCTPINLNL